ncbi:Hypothetical protein, putative [Bodo saltans]|uniref:IMS import disulfide relay-system CHCH-CHCH-like Cx9C domain-containing protein n=1 Tax=Bodo saltans TaxID=75058 RepID=A0A0S4IW01_BODSA|nr:Hypothetical protein, putative [Bodo saltans]|eukprot:CUG23490.1 Hypothetical protein, putative [Bodo saltans]
MVVEGNFYVAETVIRRELKSKFGQALTKCPTESATYAKCIDARQVNRTMERGCCDEERKALRKCVDKHTKPQLPL